MSPAKKIMLIKEALAKTQKLCAEKEKCEFDIRKKLYDWKLPTIDHDRIIKELIKDKFIDQQRYANSFVKEKFRFNKWGKIKIEYALKQKDIPNECIKNALNEIPAEEYEKLLEKELIKKLKTIKDIHEYTIKSKLMRFATSRGFENGKVFDMVSEIIEKFKK